MLRIARHCTLQLLQHMTDNIEFNSRLFTGGMKGRKIDPEITSSIQPTHVTRDHELAVLTLSMNICYLGCHPTRAYGSGL